MIDLQLLNLSNVKRAYLGKVGCMCGCKGKYFASAEANAESALENGYERHDDTDPNARLKVLRAIQLHAASGGAYGREDDYVFAEFKGKNYTIWLYA